MSQPEYFQPCPDVERIDHQPEMPPDPHRLIFNITGFSRSDLQERLKFSDEEIHQLDDAAMYRIAQIVLSGFIDSRSSPATSRQIVSSR